MVQQNNVISILLGEDRSGNTVLDNGYTIKLDEIEVSADGSTHTAAMRALNWPSGTVAAQVVRGQMAYTQVGTSNQVHLFGGKQWGVFYLGEAFQIVTLILDVQTGDVDEVKV